MNKLFILLILAIAFLGLSGCTNQPGGEAIGGLSSSKSGTVTPKDATIAEIWIEYDDGTEARVWVLGNSEGIQTPGGGGITPNKEAVWVRIVYSDGTVVRTLIP